MAGLVALSILAASLRAAGLFALFMVLAASLLVSGETDFAAVALGAAFFAAGFAVAAAGAAFFAGALAAFGAAAGFAAAALVALGAAALRAGFAEGASLFAFVAAFAVLAGARTAMACARGRSVVLWSFILKAFLDRVAACTSRGTARRGPMPRES